MAVAGLELSDELRVAAVTRRKRTFIPEGDFLLAEGDVVVAAARSGARKRIHRYLAAKGGRP